MGGHRLIGAGERGGEFSGERADLGRLGKRADVLAGEHRGEQILALFDLARAQLGRGGKTRHVGAGAGRRGDHARGGKARPADDGDEQGNDDRLHGDRQADAAQVLAVVQKDITVADNATFRFAKVCHSLNTLPKFRPSHTSRRRQLRTVVELPSPGRLEQRICPSLP